MASTLTVLDGNTFFVSDAAGDVELGDDANGFFHADMRQLSTWRLLLNGRPVHVLTSRTVDYYSASFFATLASVGVGENPPISIRRDRFVARGVHEDLTVQNHSDRPLTETSTGWSTVTAPSAIPSRTCRQPSNNGWRRRQLSKPTTTSCAIPTSRA